MSAKGPLELLFGIYEILKTQGGKADASDNLEPVTLGVSASQVLLKQTRTRVIVTAPYSNAGSVAIGGPSLTVDNAARWLEPGDSYVENDAAGAALYALAITAGDKICLEVA